MTLRPWLAGAALLGATACGADGDPLAPGAPYAIDVVRFDPGAAAGFGQARLPDVVLGPPRGGGIAAGSLDVVALGVGGVIELQLGADAVDGPGPDLVIFENAFTRAGTSTPFVEPGAVSLSEDGETFVDVPCDGSAQPFTGCAGLAPVFANTDTNALDPLDPTVSGGDLVDLAAVGLRRARFVRIRDVGPDLSMGGDAGGFDLDAVGVIHAAE